MQRTRIGRRCWWGGVLALCLALLLSAVALVPAVAHAQSGNLFSNPGFETGSLSPWVIGGAGCGTPTLDTSNPHSGTYDARIGSGFCLRPTVTQAVALTQGATYSLSAWTRGGSNQCKLGSSTDRSLASGAFGPGTTVTTTWSQLSWSFAYSGASGSVYVGLWCDLQRGYQYFDDFSLMSGQTPAALQQYPRGPTGKQIDWAHPFLAHLPAPGQPRSGIGSSPPGTALPSTPPSPAANFPGGCYRGIAYNVIVQGKTLWTATNGPIEAWVEYQWCPTYAGDPVGLNWAYGRAYVNSGCANVYVGDLNFYAHPPLGPLMRNPSGWTWDDDEYTTSYWICNGYAWDYTTTASGSGLYEVWMYAQSDYILPAIAQSPCYC